jgi:hypothetical protein
MGRDDTRKIQRRDDWEDAAPYRPRRSTAVVWLGIFNIFAGGFVLVVGMCTLLVIFAFGSEGGKLSGLGLPGLGGGAALSWLSVAAIGFWGTGAIVAGIGLLCRAGWARTCMLLLGGCAGAVGFLYLAATVLLLTTRDPGQSEDHVIAVLVSLGGAVLFLGHCAWSYVILLQERFAREFR